MKKGDAKDLRIEDIVWADPERVGGKPLFKHSRLPVRALLDYLEGGHTIPEFLADFPGITEEQVHGFLEVAFQELVAPMDRAAEADEMYAQADTP